jgi:hypothetical protein
MGDLSPARRAQGLELYHSPRPPAHYQYSPRPAQSLATGPDADFEKALRDGQGYFKVPLMSP